VRREDVLGLGLGFCARRRRRQATPRKTSTAMAIFPLPDPRALQPWRLARTRAYPRARRAGRRNVSNFFLHFVAASFFNLVSCCKT